MGIKKITYIEAHGVICTSIYHCFKKILLFPPTLRDVTDITLFNFNVYTLML